MPEFSARVCALAFVLAVGLGTALGCANEGDQARVVDEQNAAVGARDACATQPEGICKKTRTCEWDGESCQKCTCAVCQNGKCDDSPFVR
jgi:hypothetical protein